MYTERVSTRRFDILVPPSVVAGVDPVPAWTEAWSSSACCLGWLDAAPDMEPDTKLDMEPCPDSRPLLRVFALTRPTADMRDVEPRKTRATPSSLATEAQRRLTSAGVRLAAWFAADRARVRFTAATPLQKNR